MKINALLSQLTPQDIQLGVMDRLRARRKEQGLSQTDLAHKADVSLGSLKRFESSGEISLVSLVKLATALGYEEDFDSLFSQKHYRSIEDVINDTSAR